MNDDSFFSVNRLVEFGLGLAVAQQMVQYMNIGTHTMHVPGAMGSMHSRSMQSYYAVINGFQDGPFSELELARLILEKKIVKETYIWKYGMRNWQNVESLPEIFRLVALVPPPLK